MKPILYPLILTLSLILVGCEKKEPVNHGDLVERDGLWYEKYSDITFNGKTTGHIHGKYINGKREGVFLFFNSDGELLKKSNYISGSLNGFETQWDHYGNQFRHDCMIDNKIVSPKFCVSKNSN